MQQKQPDASNKMSVMNYQVINSRRPLMGSGQGYYKNCRRRQKKKIKQRSHYLQHTRSALSVIVVPSVGRNVTCAAVRKPLEVIMKCQQNPAQTAVDSDLWHDAKICDLDSHQQL